MKPHYLTFLFLLSAAATAQEPTSGLWTPVQKDRTAPTGTTSAGSAPALDGGGPLLASAPGIDPTRVYFDRPGDGRLWARGLTYKARFDETGAMFSPYLGAQAPGPRPVRFELDAIDLGGERIEFRHEVQATLTETGDGAPIVSFDRGSLVEYYVMEAESMEQRFRFERLPAGAGELSIKMRVHTDLAREETDAGFAFACDRGCVTYGRAVVLDAGGARADAPATLTPEGIELRVPAAFVEDAELPITVDPVISTFGLDDSSFLDIEPDIAYEHQSGRYMVIWQRLFNGSDWDVFGQMYNSLGNPVAGSDRYIDITDDSWEHARVASNSIWTQFLVVAQEGGVHIVGRTREAESTTQGSQFLIALGISTTFSEPDVGGDPHPVGPTYYCATWKATDSSGETDIHARLVSFNSTFPGPILTVTNDAQSDSNPQISNCNGQRPAGNQVWTIVWERRSTLFSPPGISGAQISWSGDLTPHFSISASLLDGSYNPSVSSILDGQTGDRAYLVAFERDNGGQVDILGRVMRGSTTVTPTLNLTALQGFGVSEDQNSPCVEADGSSFVLVNGESDDFTANDIYVCTFNLSGSTLVPVESHLAFSTAPNTQREPRIASMHSGGGFPGLYMSAWQTVVGLLGGNIDAGRYITPGPGEIYCTSNPNSTGSVATLRGQGSISIDKETFSVLALDCPPNKPGLFFLGPNQIDTPFGEGRRCVGGQVKRIQPVATTDSQGTAARLLDPDLPYGSGIFAGPTGVNYQFWFRDPTGGPNGFNLTDALHVEHTP